MRRSAMSWEVRESLHTPKGPRSHTLARFREMDEAVLARVVASADGPVDVDGLWEAARRAGCPEGGLSVDRAARVILAGASRGIHPIPGLRRQLESAWAGAGSAGMGDARWLTASLAERGAALRELLLLVDALPARPHPPLRVPLVGRG
ncbi:MAG: hypothetical protein ABR573_11925 [Candidatus Dormibacteria bacterium]